MRKMLLWPVPAIAAVAIGTVFALPPAVAAAERTDPGSPTAARIVWGDCPAPAAGLEVDPRQTCGTLAVPLDYRHPHGRQITLAVSRIKAGHAAARRGVLLVNPGGPGGEGLNWAGEIARRASPSVTAAYDIIGFDPRGVGHSHPVSCGLTADELVPPIAYPAADGSIDQNVAYARSAARRCAAHSGDVLKYVTTANTARDMDRVRQALGEPRISYLGSSYGTYLGAVYASLFPHRTDRFVLDSAVDPGRVWYDQFRLQSKGVAIRFPDAARDAADHAEELGLGRTPEAVTRTYLALAARLDTHPVTVPGRSIVLSGKMFRFITSAFLTQDEAIGPLTQAWRATADLSDGRADDTEIDLLQQVLDALDPRFGTSPGVPADNTRAAAYAVACDDASWPRSVSTYAANVAADRAAYPLSAGGPANLWPCAFWPTPPVEPPVEITDRGRRNLLILQNERDPGTPLESGQALHRALGRRSAMVTVDAGGHVVYGTPGADACATEAADAFLAYGRMPSRDVHCPAS